MPRWKLYLFGPPRLEYDGQPVEITLRKGLALLAYLALTQQPHSRDALATLLWPESSQSKARASLRRTLHRLNQTLGTELLTIEPENVALRQSMDFWLDVAAYQQLVTTHLPEVSSTVDVSPEHLTPLIQAAALYSGEFLAGFTLPDSPAYDDWQFFQRETLRQSLAQVLEQLVDAYQRQSAYKQAIPHARRWLALDPLHEPIHRQLMQLYAFAGQQAAAVRQYQECERILKKEMGIPPAEETTAVYEAIKTRRFVEPSHAAMPDSSDVGTQTRTVQEKFNNQFSTLSNPAPIRDRYVIEKVLAIGGHGEVYRGHDTETDHPVVVKRLKPDLMRRHPEFVQRFQREGEVLRQLDHPNIVKMLAIFEHKGQHSIVMEYVPGGSLRDLLDQGTTLPFGQIFDIGLELADALSRSHHLGIIHRDIKPGNVLLAADGTPRLTDFGIARLIRDDVRLTQSGALLGSPAYASPESLNDEEPDVRSDIWSFGVLLYEMLANRPPFVGKTLTAVMMGIMSKPVPPIGHFRTDTPSALADLLQRMLTKERTQRIDSMRQVAAELEVIGKGKPMPVYPTSFTPSRPPVIPSSTLHIEQSFSSLNQSITATPTPHIDWGEAPEIGCFYGREVEMAQLERWLLTDRCRLVTVLGMGGIGKTSLIVKLVQKLAGPVTRLQNDSQLNPSHNQGVYLENKRSEHAHFEHVRFERIIWRSLLNAPPFVDVLLHWLQFLSDQQVTQMPPSLDQSLNLLLTYLRQRRCLIVLDNCESILQGEEQRAGHYRVGYEEYGQLILRLGESDHQSCLLLTSRERPHGLRRLEGNTQLVRSLSLSGLSAEESQQFLADQGLSDLGSLTHQLAERYSGNPLALKLITETIQDLFAGDVGLFLTEETLIFDDIRAVLDQQFARLSSLEREIMIWLMLEREAVSAENILANLAQPPRRRVFLEALRSLEQRSLLTKVKTRRGMTFTLQNVVTEYTTDHFIERIGQELAHEALDDFSRHALLKAQSKDYVRESQSRLILQPIAQQLVDREGLSGLEDRLRRLLKT